MRHAEARSVELTKADAEAMSVQLLLVAILAFALALPAAAQDLQSGLRAYEEGDYREAGLALEPLARQGDPDAQFVLARMYQFGLGVAQDDAQAFAWFERAGNGGHVQARTVLGYLHRFGVGTEKDPIEAYIWFSLAAAEGDDVTASNRERLARSLSAEQLAEADARVAAWQPGRAAGPDPAGVPTAEPAAYVQLGAFRSADNASAYLQQALASRPDLLGRLQYRVEPGERGGRTLHMVQIGPLAAAAAADLCLKLRAEGFDCLLVRPPSRPMPGGADAKVRNRAADAPSRMK